MTIHQAIRTTAFSSALAFIVATVPTADAQSPKLIGNGSESVGDGMVQNGLFLQGKDSYRVVDTAGFRTAADAGATAPGTVAQVGYGQGCSSCGTSCGGTCDGLSYSSCGTGACGTGGCGTGGCGAYGAGYGGGFNNPCAPCESFCFVSMEALYMDNDTVGGFSLSPNFQLGNFDNELAGRVTIGSVPDCVHGCEITYVGNTEWNLGRTITGPAGTISTFLRPGRGFDGDNLSSFGDMSQFDANNNIFPPPFPNPEVIPTATRQRQIFEAEYWSLEVNRTMWAGDFAKMLYGARYIDYQERYVFDSLSPDAGGPGIDHAGRIVSQTDNDLYGLQVGMDLLYPICCHGFTDFRARFGGFINSASFGGALRNAVDTPDEIAIRLGDDKTDLAGIVELGAGVRYRLGDVLTIRAGTELWYLTQIASANRQFRSTINPGFGRSIRKSSDVLMTGVSLGADLRF